MARLATVAAFGFPDFNPPTLLATYRRLGCVALQFYRNVKSPPTVREALDIANDLGLVFDSIHGVFGPEYDPSSTDETFRQATIDVYRAEGLLARELGGTGIVVHPAPMCPDPASITPESRLTRVDPLLQSMEQLARIGEELGVVYLIENIPANYYFGNDTRMIAQMIRKLASPHVRMCFDTGHAHMTTDTTVADDLAACMDVVTYLHINDNTKKMDSHLIPGQGTIDWLALGEQMAKLPIGTSAMLELFNSEPEMNRQIARGLGEKLKSWLAIGRGM